MLTWILKIFAEIGIVAAVGSVLAVWILNRFGDKLNLKWKYDYQKELEKLNKNLSLQKDLFNNAIQSASSTNIKAQEKRLKSIEKLWETTLEIRKQVSDAIFIYQILYPEEYQSKEELNKPEIGAMLPEMTEEEYANEAANKSREVEKIRPFLCEKLWEYFGIYLAVSYRLALKVVKRDENDKIPKWDQKGGERDEHLYELLRLALSEEEIEEASKERLGVPQILLSLLEEKMIREASEMIRGKKVRERTLEESIELTKLLKKSFEKPLKSD